MNTIFESIKTFFAETIPNCMSEWYLYIELVSIALAVILFIVLLTTASSKRRKIKTLQKRCDDAESEVRRSSADSVLKNEEQQKLQTTIDENGQKIKVLTETIDKQTTSIFELKNELFETSKALDEKTAALEDLKKTNTDLNAAITELTNENRDLRLLETENKALLKVIARLDKIANPSPLDDKGFDYLQDIDRRLRNIEKGKRSYATYDASVLNAVTSVDDVKTLNRANLFKKAKLMGIKTSAVWTTDRLAAEICKKL